MAPDLRALVKQERFCFDTLNNVVKFIDGYDEARDKGQIAGWMDRLEGIFENFLKIRLEIDLLQDENSPTAEEGEKLSRASRDRFEKTYVKVKGFLVNALQSTSEGEGSIVSNSNRAIPVARIKLPEVKLPSFDGSVSEWLSFRDTFKSLIDSNPNLSDVDKFSYLVASLTKEAKRVVESIDITDANYTIAWQSLTKRFDNKKLVVKTYLDALLSVEPLKRENYESLSRMVDDFERNLQMIEKMNIDTKGWSVLIAHIVCSRLDTETLKQWENHHKSTDVPQYEQLMDFLRSHCIVLQSIASGKTRTSDPPRSDPTKVQKFKVSSVHSVVSSASKPCGFCNQFAHSPFKCDVFRKLSVSERYDLVKRKALCINCLSANHQVRNCSSSSCRVCNQRHHTMLHQQTPIRNASQPSIVEQNSNQLTTNPNQSQSQIASTTSPNADNTFSQSTLASTANSLSHCSTSLVANVHRIPSTVLLQTALVKVIDSSNNIQWARALLDPASQLNIVSERLVKRLQVPSVKEYHTIEGIGQSNITSTNFIVVHIQSHCCSFRTSLKFHVLKTVTRELPSNNFDVSEWNWPSNVVLADPQFNKPAAVDMIIGVDGYYDLLLDGLIRLGPGRPVLQNTLLGWVVSGRVGNSEPDPENVSIVYVCSTQDIEEQPPRFWEMESSQSSSTMPEAESACEAHFAATTTRAESGRFIVENPKKTSFLSLLWDSYDIAKLRFLSVERRLQVKPQLQSAYSAFIEEYRIGSSNQCLQRIPWRNNPSEFITGSNSVETGKNLCTQLSQLLNSAGFPLRKCSSNSSEIPSHIPESLRDQRTGLGLDPGESITTIGLKWEPASDCFDFHVPKWEQNICVPKRQFVSDSSSLFHRFGFIGPVIVVCKLFVQEFWRSKRPWDEPLKTELQQSWLQFRSELAAIETINVPRWAVPNRFWPSFVLPPFENDPAEELEERKEAFPIQIPMLSPIFSLRSSYTGLIILVAYILRFCHNCMQRNHSNCRSTFLQSVAFEESLKVLVRAAQQEYLKEDIRAIAASGEVEPNSRLKTLVPILEDRILKVGGRIRNVPNPDTREHTTILSSNYPFTKRVVTYYHQKHLHAGLPLSISYLWKPLWQLRLRNLVWKVVQVCVKSNCCKQTVPTKRQSATADENKALANI